MPSQKLCEADEHRTPARRKRCSSCRLGALPCTITVGASPSASNAARSASAISDSTRSVVVSTNMRPPTRARNAPQAATAARCAASLGLGSATARTGGRAQRSRTGCRREGSAHRPGPADSVNHARRSSSPNVAEVKTQALGAPPSARAASSRMSSGDSTSRVWCAGRRSSAPCRARRPRRNAAPAPRFASALVPLTRGSGAARRPPPALRRPRRRPAAAPPARRGSRHWRRARSSAAGVPRRSRSVPAAARRWLARAVLDGAGDLLPGLQAARLLQPGAEQVARKSAACALPSVVPKGDAGLGELVPRRTPATSTLGSGSAVPVSRSDHVGEEQVVVDDDGRRTSPLGAPSSRGSRRNSGQSAPRQFSRVDVTSRITLGRSSDRRPRRVAARRDARPARSATARARPAVGRLRALARLGEPVRAQVARAALGQRHRHRDVQRLDEPQRVAQEELVLQALGRRADERTRAARQQRRDEVRRRRSCRRRCRPRRPAPRGPRCARHGGVPCAAAPRAARNGVGPFRGGPPEAGRVDRELPAGADVRALRRDSYRLGRVELGLEVGDQVAQQQAALLQAAQREVRRGRLGNGTVDGLSRSACSMRSSISRRCSSADCCLPSICALAPGRGGWQSDYP